MVLLHLWNQYLVIEEIFSNVNKGIFLLDRSCLEVIPHLYFIPHWELNAIEYYPALDTIRIVYDSSVQELPNISICYFVLVLHSNYLWFQTIINLKVLNSYSIQCNQQSSVINSMQWPFVPIQDILIKSNNIICILYRRSVKVVRLIIS